MRVTGWLAVFYLWRARKWRRAVTKWLARERVALARSEFQVKRQQQFGLRALHALRKAEELEKRAAHVLDSNDDR